VIAEPGGPAGKANPFFYKILITKRTAQSSQAEISSKPIFAHILLCIQGGIDQQKGISPPGCFIQNFIRDFQWVPASKVFKEMGNSLSFYSLSL
jgi:hypothetical protein